MDKKQTEKKLTLKQRYQQKYRRAQKTKGLTRYEIQISQEAKARFEEMVNAAADEYTEPWSERQRRAKARARIFEEITQGVWHEFFTLKEQITHLKDEIKALSPAFFRSDENEQIPLPQAIQALPDEPQLLKQLLAKIYQNAQQAMLSAKEHQRQADQYQQLYEASQQQNEEFRELLKNQGINIEHIG